MHSKYLIIGGTGAIGFAVTKALQEAGESATLLVRNRTAAAEQLGDLSGLTLVEGDVNDTALLKDMAVGADFIFHGGNVPYDKWAKAMPVMTRNVIDAAEHAGATVIFPGNNYNYGETDQPISEITPFNPNTRLGQVRVELEKMLQRATDQGRIRTLVVRMAEIWGPNVTNKQFAPIFENALKGRKLPWIISASTPQQLLYSKDAGRAIVLLTRRDDLDPYAVFNLAGTRVPSMESWLKQVGEIAGKPAGVSVLPKRMLSVLGTFVPILREVRSMAYKYETSVLLNDDRFTGLYPDFHQTPMPEAMAETLKWFADNGENSNRNRNRNRAKRRKTRVDAVVRFAVDNVAIGVFPVAIGLAATQIPALEGFAMYMAVAAGIYWTPGLHGLTDKLRGRAKAV
ncbi:MAG: NAD-dependent epimerase/dehydratase family protein [Hyphomicrobiales bacterium]|nr:NAD-dependent epimerase/dehydratase family protein [Hyphomicrobiales bacterium]